MTSLDLLSPSGWGGAPSPVSPSSRMDHAEELCQASRLLERRRELLAIALLDPAARVELESIAAEVAAGSQRIDAVVDEPEIPPEAARARFEEFRARLTGTAGEARSPRDGVASATQTRPAPLPPEFEGPVRANLDVLDTLRLQRDSVERILQSSWVNGPSGSGGAAGLPPALRERVRWLQSQSDEIVERFVTAHQGLVSRVVRRYRGLGLSREDLMQDGNIGLLRAVERFDERRARPFAAYAVWWVRDSVRRALAFQARTIRLPVSALARRHALGRALNRLSQKLGRPPSEEELARATGVAAASIADVMSAAREPLSLDAPRSGDSELTLGDAVADWRALNPNEHASARERADKLRSLLEGLTPRERRVLELRFGLDGDGERTLEEIGKSLDLTRERIRQIVMAALAKLSQASRQRRLGL